MVDLKALFLLDPEVTYLNHGSYGACPGPVFERYQDWQRQLERQPVEFLGRRFASLMAGARVQLAAFLGTKAEQVVYFPNPTTALNLVARNLRRLVEGHSQRPLLPGDQVLSSDHEYGALDRTWRTICGQNQLEYRKSPLPLPLADPQTLLEQFWAGVSERTRLIFISHITSPTALTFPVEQIIRRARAEGILTVIDGAHAPGQIDLALDALGVDIYVGACHKWLMAPKGSGFLFARPELQDLLEPLVISWGYQPEEGYGSGVAFIDQHEWQGTRDLAAFLSVPAAIEFQRVYAWERVRQDCHQMAVEARRHLNQLTGCAPLCRDEDFLQMFTVQLPEGVAAEALVRKLYTEYRIEVPAIHWNGQSLLRISIQGYNSPSDIDRLVQALENEL